MSRMRAVHAYTAAALLAVPLAPTSSHAQSWTDWTTSTQSSGTAPGTATGTLSLGGSSITVGYTGDVFANTQTSCGIDYWAVNGAVYTSPANGLTAPPPGCDIVTLVGGGGRPGVQTLTFSQAVQNPILAILSLGQPAVPVAYNFDAPFEVLNSGAGYWGGSAAGSLFADAATVLRGLEGHGLIRFTGTLTSISWTVPNAETWHGFTVGAGGQATSVVPEPGTVVLLASGLLALGAGVVRRRRG